MSWLMLSLFGLLSKMMSRDLFFQVFRSGLDFPFFRQRLPEHTQFPSGDKVPFMQLKNRDKMRGSDPLFWLKERVTNLPPPELSGWAPTRTSADGWQPQAAWSCPTGITIHIMWIWISIFDEEIVYRKKRARLCCSSYNGLCRSGLQINLLGDIKGQTEITESGGGGGCWSGKTTESPWLNFEPQGLWILQYSMFWY